MRCPRCAQESPEGAAICDNCDEILDASFLESDAALPVAGERTDVGPTPTAAAPGRRDLRPARLTQRGGWNARPGAPEPAAEKRPYLAPPPPPPPPDVLVQAQKSAGDLRSFFASLSAPDRLAAGGAAALLFTLTLPWQWTKREDDIIGLVAAWPLAFLAAGVVALVYLRTRGADVTLERRLRLLQAAAASLAAAGSGLFLPYASESKAVRAAGLVVPLAQSKPAVGAYLGLICAVAMALGALLSLSRR